MLCQFYSKVQPGSTQYVKAGAGPQVDWRDFLKDVNNFSRAKDQRNSFAATSARALSKVATSPKAAESPTHKEVMKSFANNAAWMNGEKSPSRRAANPTALLNGANRPPGQTPSAAIGAAIQQSQDAYTSTMANIKPRSPRRGPQ